MNFTHCLTSDFLLFPIPTYSAYTRAMESTENTIQCITTSADLDQRKNTGRLEERAREVADWQGEIQVNILKFHKFDIGTIYTHRADVSESRCILVSSPEAG